MATQKRTKISDLKFDSQNINKGSEFGQSLLEKSLQENGAGRSILLDKNGIIIAGNQTAQKASEIGMEDVIVVQTDGRSLVAVQRTDLDINTPAGAKMKILDNTVSKHNYVEDIEIAEAICEEYDLDAKQLGLQPAKEPDPDNLYSRDIKSPAYEPKNTPPDITDLVNIHKAKELIQEITQSQLPEAEKTFLINAAQRHLLFNYEKIADYYAHASKEMQQLMEKSALVIIDFHQAIEYGFVRLTKEIQEQYSDDYDAE